jgi:hypothetical protein
MAIDIKNLVQLIQKKEHAVTSSTSVQDMIDILKAAQKAEGSLIRNYDSAGDLPDAATTDERIAYLSDTRTLRFNNGTWDNPLLGAAAAAAGFVYQGSNYGYASGGYTPVSPYSLNVIQKYSFTADGNSTDVGDLTLERREAAGTISSTHGYVISSSNSDFPTMTAEATIEKFAFVSDGNGIGVGDLANRERNLATGNSSGTHGYVSGGGLPSPNINDIQKFTLSVDANATDVGDLTTTVFSQSGGASSTTHGYRSGGQQPANLNVIDKWPFSTDANATDVGDLLTTRVGAGGQSSTTHGYAVGGSDPGWQNQIQKYSFSVDENSTDVGDLTSAARYPATSSSTTDGYSAGGQSPASINIINKHPFTVDANATDVGDLLSATYSASGAHY